MSGPAQSSSMVESPSRWEYYSPEQRTVTQESPKSSDSWNCGSEAMRSELCAAERIAFEPAPQEPAKANGSRKLIPPSWDQLKPKDPPRPSVGWSQTVLFERDKRLVAAAERMMRQGQFFREGANQERLRILITHALHKTEPRYWSGIMKVKRMTLLYRIEKIYMQIQAAMRQHQAPPSSSLEQGC